jgi:hypothetical protein
MEYIWKVNLKDNPFGEEETNSYIGEVSTYGSTMHNKDIANAMVEEGTEYRAEAILEILSRRDRIVQEAIGRGESVQDDNFHYGPYIGGILEGADAKFNPEKNRTLVRARPTEKLRKLLKSIKVEIIGVKSQKTRLGRVFDFATEKIDEVITPNDEILITGTNIQIVPIDDTAMGIFFTNVDTGEVFRVTTKLRGNLPKSVRAKTPALTDGKYELKIVTRYSGRKNALLKTPRVMILHVKLTVTNNSDDKSQNPSDSTNGTPSDSTNGKPSDSTNGKPSDDTNGKPSDDTNGKPSDDTNGKPSDDTK